MQQNEMRLVFDSRSCNESFARVVVAAFMTQLNPTIEEVDDVKTAVSEAVTNVIIHAYGNRAEDTGNVREHCPMSETGDVKEAVNKIEILCRIQGDMLEVVVSDTGCGIADVKQAMEPLFTTRTECDRAGMGFAFMEAFMDTLEVDSALGKGTRVRMTKRIARETKMGASVPCAHADVVLTERQEADRWSTPLR